MLPGKVLQDWRIYRCPWSDVNAWSNVFSFVLECETLSVFSVVLSFLVFASFSAGDGSERDALFCVCRPRLCDGAVRLERNGCRAQLRTCQDELDALKRSTAAATTRGRREKPHTEEVAKRKEVAEREEVTKRKGYSF